jgi:hypothetical protein
MIVCSSCVEFIKITKIPIAGIADIYGKHSRSPSTRRENPNVYRPLDNILKTNRRDFTTNTTPVFSYLFLILEEE